MTKRLSEIQKKELVQKFKSGKSIDVLSKEFDCTKSTVSRNLKKNLGDIKYKELIQKNKSHKKKTTGDKKYNNSVLDQKNDDEVFKKDIIDLKTSEIPYEQTITDLLNYWREKVKNNKNKFLTR